MTTLGNEAGSGISTYLNKPINVRRAYVEIQSNPLVPAPLPYKIGSYLVNITFFSNILGGVILTSKKNIKWIGLLPFLGALISSLAILGRFTIVTSFAFIFLSYLIFSFFTSPKRQIQLLRNLLLTTTLSVVGLYFLFYSIVLARYSINMDLQDYFNKTIYFYFSGGVSALDDFLKTDYNHSYGTSSFRSVFKWLNRLGIWPDNQNFSSYDQFTKVSPSLSINTYTYIRSLFIDFGIAGVLFISFIWGGITKISLKKIYSKFSFTNLFLACIMVYSSLMTFYSFYFESLSMIIFWILPVFLFRKQLQKCYTIVDRN